jgi:hypothetical protein
MTSPLFSMNLKSMTRPPDWRSGFTARIMEFRDPAVTLYQTNRRAPDAPLIFYIRRKHGLWTRPTDWELFDDGWTGPDDQAYGDGIPEAEEYRRTASPWTRAVTESWILARLNDEEVAGKVGLRPTAVKWYERLFFHVRDRLNCDMYIRAIIKNWALKPIPEDVVKQYGYFAGPPTLELVLKHWDGDPRPVFDPADVDRDQVTARERLSVFLSVMCRLLPMKTSERELRELNRMMALSDSLHGNEAGDPTAGPGESKWSDFFRQNAPDHLVPPESVAEPVDPAQGTPSKLVMPASPRGARRKAQHTVATPV